MIRVSRVVSIAKKELRETLRDRRTLFLLVFLPILLYPMLLLTVTQLAWRHVSAAEERVSEVIVDSAAADHPLVVAVGENEKVRVSVREDAETLRPAQDPSVDAVVIVKDLPLVDDGAAQGQLVIHYNSVDANSRVARDRLEDAVDEWAIARLRERLESRQLDENFAEPVIRSAIDVSDRSERGGHLLAGILPLIVLATLLLAATWPATDAMVGEHERGTLQTLLTLPITTPEILAGKFVSVLVITLICGAANLFSLALLFGQNLLLSADLFSEINISIPLLALPLLLWAIVLMGMFLSSLLLAAVSVAKSHKEAQVWILPAYLIGFAPAVIAQVSDMALTAQLAVAPSLNIMLLMKESITGAVTINQLFLVTASTFIYTGLLLLLGARLFNPERILLGRGADGSLFGRPPAGATRERPTVGEALAWTGICFVLLFYIGSLVQDWSLLPGLALTLWVVLLAPTLGLARYLRLNFRATFNLRPISWRAALLAIMVGLTAWAPLLLINDLLGRTILEVPPEMLEAMAELFIVPESPLGWIVLLGVVAVTPAICEELIFRGWLFTGLRDRVGPAALIVITALLFGLFHLSLYRLVGTTLLGLVLGLFVLRTGSVFPAMIVHLVNNAVALTLLPHEEALTEDGLPIWPLLALTLLFTICMPLLFRLRPLVTPPPSEPPPSDPPSVPSGESSS